MERRNERVEARQLHKPAMIDQIRDIINISLLEFEDAIGNDTGWIGLSVSLLLTSIGLMLSINPDVLVKWIGASTSLLSLVYVSLCIYVKIKNDILKKPRRRNENTK